MQIKGQINRRQFIKLSAGSAVVVPFFVSLPASAGAHLPRVEEDDAQAMALGYKHDSAEVDQAKHAKHTPEQICSGCTLYQGKDGDEWGPCAIFPGKEVAAAGWCSAFVAG